MFIITFYVFRNEEPEHGISVPLVLRSGQSYQFSMYKYSSHLLEIDFTYTLYDKTGFVLSDEKNNALNRLNDGAIHSQTLSMEYIEVPSQSSQTLISCILNETSNG